jgi:hypothetical protein
MPDGGDSDEPPGETIDRLTLDAGIARHIARLDADPDDDPIAHGIAAYLRQSRDLYEFMAGVANRRGQSFTHDVKRSLRNEFLRELGRTAETEIGKTATGKAKDLAKEIADHRPRDTNPYSQFSERRKWLLGEVCRLNDGRPIGWRRLYDILQRDRI